MLERGNCPYCEIFTLRKLHSHLALFLRDGSPVIVPSGLGPTSAKAEYCLISWASRDGSGGWVWVGLSPFSCCITRISWSRSGFGSLPADFFWSTLDVTWLSWVLESMAVQHCQGLKRCYLAISPWQQHHLWKAELHLALWIGIWGSGSGWCVTAHNGNSSLTCWKIWTLVRELTQSDLFFRVQWFPHNLHPILISSLINTVSPQMSSLVSQVPASAQFKVLEHLTSSVQVEIEKIVPLSQYLTVWRLQLNVS